MSESHGWSAAMASGCWLAAGWLVFSLLLQVMLLEYYVHFGFVA